VRLALIAKTGEMGYPSVLTAKTWGFYDVLFKGNEFKFQRPYGSYVMEHVLFKISFPAEFHSQTAVEAAMTINEELLRLGKTPDDIKKITIRTHEACIRIIDKKGPLNNPADRDHCIQYMVAVPILFGRLTAGITKTTSRRTSASTSCATRSCASRTRASPRTITTRRSARSPTGSRWSSPTARR
jgi:2-methylcitrate dehydratase